MEIKDMDPWLALTAHQKLRFKVSRSVRCIFMAIDNEGVLVFRAYFEKEPTEDDRELVSDAAAETAYSFVELSGSRTECVHSKEPFEELEKLSYWLFVRAEEISEIDPPAEEPSPASQNE